MTRKIFLICLTLLLIMQGAALAKENSGLSKGKHIKIAVEVTDDSRHKELGTAARLEKALIEELSKKNLAKISNQKTFEDTLAEKKLPLENLGELLIFDALELPGKSQVPADFNQTSYKNLGVDYVVHCEVLALGLAKVEDNMTSTAFGVTGGIISLIGSGNNSRDKTLRRVGTGIGLGSYIPFERTALNTVVHMQFISVATGEVIWEKNFMGQAMKHHKPYDGYDDVLTQAYIESVGDSAKIIAKRVNKYVDKVIIKGKNDKEFTSNNSSLVKFSGGSLF